MRMKLRPSTLYGAGEDGVFLQTPRGSFTLRLPAPLIEPTQRWLRALEAPATMNDLLAITGGSKAAAVAERVLRHLRERGALLEVPDTDPHPGLPPAVRSYLESHAEDPYPAMKLLAGASVLVRGPAHTAQACAAALEERGIRCTVADAAADTVLQDPVGTVRVTLGRAGRCLWVAATDLAPDADHTRELRRRLDRPGEPRPAAERLAAVLAADQAFRELVKIPGAFGAVHVVDSSPLGWRTVQVDKRPGPAPDTATALAPGLSAADELLGLYRFETPDDWDQLPASLARIVPGPGATIHEAATGWGYTEADARHTALRSFLRGATPGRGAGPTQGAAVLDAALRLLARRLLEDPVTGVRAEPPAATAEFIPGAVCRVYPAAPGGAVLAEVRGPAGCGAGWGESTENALDRAVGAYLALTRRVRFGAAALSEGVLLDSGIADRMAVPGADAVARAEDLLGSPVRFQADPPDLLLGHAPLASGRLLVEEGLTT
ncbi:hypothetical protein [Streptomyces sp. NPDC054834]